MPHNLDACILGLEPWPVEEDEVDSIGSHMKQMSIGGRESLQETKDKLNQLRAGALKAASDAGIDVQSIGSKARFVECDDHDLSSAILHYANHKYRHDKEKVRIYHTNLMWLRKTYLACRELARNNKKGLYSFVEVAHSYTLELEKIAKAKGINHKAVARIIDKTTRDVRDVTQSRIEGKGDFSDDDLDFYDTIQQATSPFAVGDDDFPSSPDFHTYPRGDIDELDIRDIRDDIEDLAIKDTNEDDIDEEPTPTPTEDQAQETAEEEEEDDDKMPLLLKTGLIDGVQLYTDVLTNREYVRLSEFEIINGKAHKKERQSIVERMGIVPIVCLVQHKTRKLPASFIDIKSAIKVMRAVIKGNNKWLLPSVFRKKMAKQLLPLFLFHIENQ